MSACRFGCSDRNPAVARIATPAGCLCYPDDREQWLCLHHAMRATAPGATLLTYAPDATDDDHTVLARRYTAPAADR